jgi:hypothetical protein
VRGAGGGVGGIIITTIATVTITIQGAEAAAGGAGQVLRCGRFFWPRSAQFTRWLSCLFLFVFVFVCDRVVAVLRVLPRRGPEQDQAQGGTPPPHISKQQQLQQQLLLLLLRGPFAGIYRACADYLLTRCAESGPAHHRHDGNGVRSRHDSQANAAMMMMMMMMMMMNMMRMMRRIMICLPAYPLAVPTACHHRWPPPAAAPELLAWPFLACTHLKRPQSV